MPSALRRSFLGAAGSLALGGFAQADFTFNDFSSADGLTLVGSATTSGNLLRIAPAIPSQAGAVWHEVPQRVVDGFVMECEFRMSGGADGMALVLQGHHPGYLGSEGCALAYHGLPNSLAVELDAWQNGSCEGSPVGDPNGNHLSVHTGGTGPNSVAESFSIGSTSSIPNLSDGQVHTLRLIYGPGLLEVFVDDLVNPRLQIAVDLASTLDLNQGHLLAGFTAATGGATQDHDVLSWSMVSVGPGGGAGNLSPDAPTISEPKDPWQVLNPADVHMEVAPFSDPDVGDGHLCSDWEIWSLNPLEAVWVTSCIGGVERLHTHLGDGVFQGSHTGMTELMPQRDYVLRTRHRDTSGDPSSEWSPWAQRVFKTGALGSFFPLEIDDVATVPDPSWTDTGSGTAVVLAGGLNPPHLRLESGIGQLLLEIEGLDGIQNQVTNPAALSAHEPVKVILYGGANGLTFGATDLFFAEHGCDFHTILLPAVIVPPGQRAYYWATADGATWDATAGQTTPVFTQLARGLATNWAVRQAGFEVEVFATGFELPVNIAFKPNAGTAPDDPYFYVTELYGIIKVVSRDGTVSDYATGLLDFSPTGAFPGSGEQGVTGIAVDPVTGDLFVSMLHAMPGNPSIHLPKIDRFTSLDGGRTFATRTTILDMVGEPQGQSHQISNLTIHPDGKLIVHNGDGFDASTALDMDSFRGKILRMNLDGSPAMDNPFYNPAGGINSRDYIWAYGVRNPFGGAHRASDGLQYVVENGPSVDRFAQVVPGRNFGWNGSEASMFTHAIHNWQPAAAPVNLAFVEPETFGGSGFPAAKQGHVYVAESGATYASGPQTRGKRLTEWVLDAAGNVVQGPTTVMEYVGMGKATLAGLAAGPDGLYLSDLYRDDGAFPSQRGANILRVRAQGAGDCNGNLQPDACDIALGVSQDCNGNGIPDECDISQGSSTDCDGNGVPDECEVAPYCAAKLNSLGCLPTISASGCPTPPSLSGPDTFTVQAQNVRSQAPGMLIWSRTAASQPFGGGLLCLGVPVRRTSIQNSGGSTSPVDCTGSYSHLLSHAFFASEGLVAGDQIHVQFWSRDPGFSAPGNIGLTSALAITIQP